MKLGISVSPEEVGTLASMRQEFPVIRHVSVGFEAVAPLPNFDWAEVHAHGLTTSFHPIDLNLCGHIDSERLKNIAVLVRDGKCLYLEEDLGYWLSGEMFLGSHLINPALTTDLISASVQNIRTLQHEAGIGLAVENPPIYWTPDGMDFWDFFSELCAAANCRFACDVGHYIGWALASGKGVKIPGSTHPIWRSIQTIHVSGVRLWSWLGLKVWSDKHSSTFSRTLIDIAGAIASRSKDTCHCILLEMEGADHQTRSYNINSILSQEWSSRCLSAGNWGNHVS